MQETYHSAKSVKLFAKARPQRASYLVLGLDWNVVGPILLVGLGLGLRLFQLDAKSLRLDESYNYGTATGVSSWDLLTGKVYRSGHPPFFYLAWHQWIKYLGNDEFVLRLPMALASTLQIPAIYLAGRRLFNAQVALIAAIGITFSPFLVFYGQEAGVYSFFATAAALMLALFWQALVSPKISNWLLFSLAGLVTLYIHFFALFIFAAEPLIVLPLLLHSKPYQNERLYQLTSKQSLRRGWLLSLAIRAAALLPILPTLVNTAHQPAANSLPFVGLPQIFYRLLKTYTYRLPILNDSHSLPELLPTILATILLTIGAFPAIAFVRSWFSPKFALITQPEKPNEGLAGYALVWWLIIPPIIVFGLSLVVHSFSEPYLIFGTNFFWLLVANGLMWLWHKFGRVGSGVALAMGLVLIVSAVWWLGYIYFDPRFDREPWRQAGAYLANEAVSGDILLLEPDYDYKVVSYYYLGYLPLPAFLMGTPYTQTKAQELLAAAAADHPPHIWLILRRDDTDIGTHGLLRQQLDRTMRLDKTWDENLLEMREYSAK